MCGRRWIRTTEGISQQIYSLPHLATLVFALVLKSAAKICLKIRLCKQLGAETVRYVLAWWLFCCKTDRYLLITLPVYFMTRLIWISQTD